MRRTWLRIGLVLLPLLVIGFHIVGCSKDRILGERWDSAPQTELTYAPLDADTASFRVHLYWNGYDNDGQVVGFRFAVDRDTIRPLVDWTATTAHDSIIAFPVDAGSLTGGHVFWIVAEDNSGRFDSTPAKRYFSVRTLLPTSEITHGPLDRSGTSSSVTFGWRGVDPDGGPAGGSAAVDSFEYLLLRPGRSGEDGHPPLPYDYSLYLDLINRAEGQSLPAPYDDWKWTGIAGTTRQFSGLPKGAHVFAVRAVDAAGARERSLAMGKNIRYFEANAPFAFPNPILTISSPLLTALFRVEDSPGHISPYDPIETLEGETVPFAWTGSPGASGSPIAGYSAAVDDTTTPAWSTIDPRLVAMTLPADLSQGPHLLFVRAVDMAGGTALAVMSFTVVHPVFRDPPSAQNPPSMLMVDDFAPPPGDWNTAVRGSPNFPRDDAEDAWWQGVVLGPLANEFGVRYEQWDAVQLGVTGRQPPPLRELARHRVVIWYVDLNNTISLRTALWRTVAGGTSSALASYVRAGGTLIVTGFQLAGQTSYFSGIPYDESGNEMCARLDPNSLNWRSTYFPREFMGIDRARASDKGLRSQGARDFVEARTTTEGTSLGFQTALVDTGGPGTGAKWDPYAFPGSVADVKLAPGLPTVDGWTIASSFACLPQQGLLRRENPGAPIAVPVFTYHGVDQGVLQDRGPSPREGLVVGIATQAHDMGQSDGSIVTSSSARGVMGRMVFLGFPIYYAKDEQAYAVMRAAFAYVNASPTLPACVP